MNKYFLIALLLLLAGTVTAQKKGSLLHVIKSDHATDTKTNGVELIKVYQAVFQQDNMTLSSDSANFYPQQNACDAFGHVIITQGDTLHVFGDKLHYEGNTKIAIMTDNVRLIDRDAILTTNYFTYNTATRYGTYTGGGKLVNKDNTLTSKNGYYFASSRDAYFRYDVVLNTVDAIIKTDTLRYNSGTRIAYFYGPTNIYGKKDKDTLYTENGLYNTQTEQAFFGKKNEYKQNTKSLKGDSLFYDRLIGYGKAVKHVIFYDSEQKITLHGDLGEYFKKTERTLMTQHPYVVFVTENKDTSKTSKADSLKSDSLLTRPKTGTVKKPALTPPQNTVPVLNASQLKAAKDKARAAMATVPASKKDSLIAEAKTAIVKNPALIPPVNTMPVLDANQLNAAKNKIDEAISMVPAAKKDSLIAKAKKAAAKSAALKQPKNTKPVIDKTGLKEDKYGNNVVVKSIPSLKKDTLLKKDTSRVKRDSIFMTGDTIETQIMVYKDLKVLKEARRIAGLRDTSIKIIPSIVYTKPVKYIDLAVSRMRSDTTVFHRNYFRRVVVKDTSKHKLATIGPPKKGLKLPAPKYVGIDSVNISQEVTLSDTARVRILTVAHHAKIFKSDLQAKADSIFFSYADSVARMYYKPMIWVQDSQLSADTINLQMKHKQLDNVELYPSSFIVNIEKRDSTHFNQVGGKKMRGFFKDSKMRKMFVFGNAETIYFDRDSGKVTQMHHSISSKIRVNFKSNEPLDVTWYVKPDATVTPINKVKEENKVLKGFLWKPEERPVSKESIINPVVVKPPAKKATGKTPTKDQPAKGVVKGAGILPIKMGSDSLKLKGDTLQRVKLKADAIKTKPDTLQHIKTKADSTKLKTDTTKIKTKHEPAKQ